MLLILSLLAASASAQAASDATSRPCKANVADHMETRKPKSGKKRKGVHEGPRWTHVCMELKVSALGAQEYLQNFVREQRWSIGSEQANDETWTFSIYLDKENLGHYTKPLVDPKVEWRSGKGQVLIRTIEQKNGYTQVVVSARFDGYGEPEDTFAMKREFWNMESNETLESALISALEAHVKSTH